MLVSTSRSLFVVTAIVRLYVPIINLEADRSVDLLLVLKFGHLGQRLKIWTFRMLEIWFGHKMVTFWSQMGFWSILVAVH